MEYGGREPTTWVHLEMGTTHNVLPKGALKVTFVGETSDSQCGFGLVLSWEHL